MVERKRVLRSVLRLAAALLAASAFLHSGCGSGLHDTGFTGTWERRLPGGYSSLSIREQAGGYAVRWSKLDGAETVRCDDRGQCEEFVGEEKVYEWRFQPFLRPDTEDLFLEVVGSPLDDTTPALRYIDRLQLRGDGLELWSYQVSENGVDRDPPVGPRVFKKTSDQPL
jgi:hypothetical protein